MRALVLIVSCALFLVGCDEIPETHYATASAAAQDRAFERGWLPAVLLPDATDIHEAHDIDSNHDVGQFTLNAALLKRLEASCHTATANPATLPNVPTKWSSHADSQRLRKLPVVRCDDFFVATDVKSQFGYYWTPGKPL